MTPMLTLKVSMPRATSTFESPGILDREKSEKGPSLPRSSATSRALPWNFLSAVSRLLILCLDKREIQKRDRIQQRVQADVAVKEMAGDG